MRHLPLTPLIDVMFILIIFFMLTTSFMKIESMELSLPSASKVNKASEKNLTQIFLMNDGSIRYGQRPVERPELRKTLESVFAGHPDHRVLLLTEDQVSLQTLVELMDTVYMSGGKNVFVHAWQPPAENAPPVPAPAG